jgi:hypothetical protein
MAGLPPQGPRQPRRSSGAFLSLVAVSLSELRRDLDHLHRSAWSEAIRRRADELASTLADACERQGLPDLVVILRPISNLARLTRSSALPVQAELRREFDGLLREAEKRLSRHSRKYLGC